MVTSGMFFGQQRLFCVTFYDYNTDLLQGIKKDTLTVPLQHPFRFLYIAPYLYTLTLRVFLTEWDCLKVKLSHKCNLGFFVNVYDSNLHVKA